MSSIFLLSYVATCSCQDLLPFLRAFQPDSLRPYPKEPSPASALAPCQDAPESPPSHSDSCEFPIPMVVFIFNPLAAPFVVFARCRSPPTFRGVVPFLRVTGRRGGLAPPSGSSCGASLEGTVGGEAPPPTAPPTALQECDHRGSTSLLSLRLRSSSPGPRGG